MNVSLKNYNVESLKVGDYIGYLNEEGNLKVLEIIENNNKWAGLKDVSTSNVVLVNDMCNIPGLVYNFYEESVKDTLFILILSDYNQEGEEILGGLIFNILGEIVF